MIEIDSYMSKKNISINDINQTNYMQYNLQDMKVVEKWIF